MTSSSRLSREVANAAAETAQAKQPCVGTHRQLWLIVALIALAILPSVGFVLFYELPTAGHVGFPLDDSWIHVVFARNIAGGHPFAYNAGEPVSGSTAPLWTLLLGAGYRVTGSAVLMPKVVGIALLVPFALYTYRLVEYATSLRGAAFVTAALAVLATRLVWAGPSGMEVTLYVALAAAATYYYVRRLDEAGWRALLGTAVAAASVLARPEMVVLAACMVAHQLGLRLLHARTACTPGAAREIARELIPGRRVLSHLALYAALVTPFFAINYATSRQLLPSTFAAKTSAEGLLSVLKHADWDWISLLHRAWSATWFMLWTAWRSIWVPDNAALACLFPAVVVWFAVELARGRFSLIHSVIGFSLLHALLYPPVRGLVTGWPNFAQYGRYGANLTQPFLVASMLSLVVLARRYAGTGSDPARARNVVLGFGLLAAGAPLVFYGARGLLGRGHQWPTDDWSAPFLMQGQPIDALAVCLLVAVATGTGLWLLAGRRPVAPQLLVVVMGLQALAFPLVEWPQVGREYGWNVRNIEDTQVTLGRWLEREFPQPITYATNDIGAMAFFAPRHYVVDVMGLIRPEIVDKLEGFRLPSGEFRRLTNEGATLYSLYRWRPRVLVCFDEWFPTLVRDGQRVGFLRELHRVEIPNNITCGRSGVRFMKVYAVDYAWLADMLRLTGLPVYALD